MLKYFNTSKQKNKLFTNGLCIILILFSIYNSGSGVPIKISELVSLVILESGKKLKVNFDLSKPTIMSSVHLDITKSFNELLWFPKYTLSQGVQKTIQWWQKNIKI